MSACFLRFQLDSPTATAMIQQIRKMHQKRIQTIAERSVAQQTTSTMHQTTSCFLAQQCNSGRKRIKMTPKISLHLITTKLRLMLRWKSLKLVAIFLRIINTILLILLFLATCCWRRHCGVKQCHWPIRKEGIHDVTHSFCRCEFYLSDSPLRKNI